MGSRIIPSFWNTIKLLSTKEGGLSTTNCSFPRTIVSPLNSPLSLIGLGVQILMLGFRVSMLDNYQKAGHTPTVIMLIFLVNTCNSQKNKSKNGFYEKYYTLFSKDHQFFHDNHQLFEVFEITRTNDSFVPINFQISRRDNSFNA